MTLSYMRRLGYLAAQCHNMIALFPVFAIASSKSLAVPAILILLVNSSTFTLSQNFLSKARQISIFSSRTLRIL